MSEKPPATRNLRGFNAITVYRTLRDEILSLTLQPGQLIDEASLAARFAVSRSPVREAMVRLVAGGLLKTLPNKGTIVAPLRLEEFPQYIDALDLLQRALCRLAAQLRDDADLDAIAVAQQKYLDAVRQKDVPRMILNNRDFHLAIADAARNPYLRDAYKQLLDQGRRNLSIFYQAWDKRQPDDATHDHDALIKAIRDRDADAAEHQAQQHAQQMQSRFLAHLATRRTHGIDVAIPRET